MMASVYDGLQDVSDQHNPKSNRWIKFQSDLHFASGGEPYGPNTGKWFYEPETQTLFLDSDVGEEDDSYWVIKVESKEMTWQGTNSEWAERFRLTHRRAAGP